MPHSALTVRHSGDGLLLTRLRRPADPAPVRRSWRAVTADRSIGPVRAWTMSIATPGRRPTSVAVQRVAPSVALAAAPLTAGRHTLLTVTVVPASGRPVTFTTRMMPARAAALRPEAG